MKQSSEIVTNTKLLLQEELQRIVTTIADKYQPEKIILFGSLANGSQREWSDIDLLIIKETNTRRLHRRAEALQGVDRGSPLDVIILTPSELRYLLKKNSWFIRGIFENGHILYEREKPLV